MKVAIIGAGLSGCTIARLLKDRGHDVIIFEKQDRLGGLCATAEKDGKIYQLSGPHNFHTDNDSVIKFVSRFVQFNDYVHYKGTCIDGKIVPYPISYETINMLDEKEQILKEISSLPRDLDMTNFETYIMSMIGNTLYEKFIKNYTTKFWGISPKNLQSDWVAKRIEIRQDNNLGYFKKEWQGLPIHGYTKMLEKMIEGIDVHCNIEVKNYEHLRYDLVVSTIPIDELFHFRFGRLKYQGLRFVINFQETQWENKRYGCINYPNNDAPYIRKTNFSLCYDNTSSSSYIVGYDYPDKKGRMYPLYNSENMDILNKYSLHLAKIKNVISAGRLGLFRYYDMDEAIKWCLENIGYIENYTALNPETRMRLLT